MTIYSHTPIEASTAAFSSAIKDKSESCVERLTVVLDMDECLIHSKYYDIGLAAALYRSKGSYSEYTENVENFWVPYGGGLLKVNMRPGLIYFLREVSQTCNIVVFTAGLPEYAGPILDRLDPTGRLISRRFYRTSCTQIRNLFLKDLSTLGYLYTSSPGRCILIDNNPCSFLLQPRNGVLVTSFYDDPKDTALLSVTKLIHFLEHMTDVRPILNDMFHLDMIVEEYRISLSPEIFELEEQYKKNSKMNARILEYMGLHASPNIPRCPAAQSCLH